MSDDRISNLEEALAHVTLLAEELNEIVTDQANRIEVLERRMALMMHRAAQQEADQMTGEPLADQRPPHW